MPEIPKQQLAPRGPGRCPKCENPIINGGHEWCHAWLRDELAKRTEERDELRRALEHEDREVDALRAATLTVSNDTRPDTCTTCGLRLTHGNATSAVAGVWCVCPPPEHVLDECRMGGCTNLVSEHGACAKHSHLFGVRSLPEERLSNQPECPACDGKGCWACAQSGKVLPHNTIDPDYQREDGLGN